MKQKASRLTSRSVPWIVKKGKGVNNETIRMKWAFSRTKDVKFTTVASLKVDSRAVKRNLVKRRIREAFQCQVEKIKTPVNIVFFASKGTVSKDFEQIKQEISFLLKKARLI